jgi:hypothetical protein
MSNKSNKPIKKLQLNREVLRTLNSETLGEVQGGISVIGVSAACTAGQRCLTLHCTATKQ